MKADIHPTYYSDAKVVCACGNTWTTGSTRKEIHVEVCSKCHSFFSGEQQRIMDIEGQVDRFYKKLQARKDYVESQQAKEDAKLSPKRSIAELELGTRPTYCSIQSRNHGSGSIVGQTCRRRCSSAGNRWIWPKRAD